MSNMSYCRFRNTLSDLRDCFDNWEDIEPENTEELQAQARLLKLCIQVARNYGDDAVSNALYALKAEARQHEQP